MVLLNRVPYKSLRWLKVQNLKISRGKIITVKKNENDSVSQGDGAAVAVAPRVRLK